LPVLGGGSEITSTDHNNTDFFAKQQSEDSTQT